MTIPINARVFWFGTAASIPTGWSRDTNFDEKFIEGVLTDIAADGGGSHSHTQSHNHTGNTHTHNVTGPSVTPQFTSNRTRDIFGANRSAVTHGHVQVTSPTATITYQNDTTSTSSDAAKPPFTKAIVIKPDDALQDVPDDAVVLGQEVPTGWNLTDGTSGTINLSTKFIIGADAAGDGSGTGGSSTHNHTIANHTHQDDQHAHGFFGAGATTLTVKYNVVVANQMWNRLGHHDILLRGTTLSDVSTDAATIDNATFEPEFIKLLGIQNITGAAATPTGIIIMWIGTTSNIPNGENWYLCDGTRTTPNITSKQIKITTSDLEVEDTGGSNTHTHTSSAHGHTHSGTHVHSTTTNQVTEALGTTIPTTITHPSITKTHSHPWTISSTTPTIQNASISPVSADGRFTFKEVNFIKKLPPLTVHIKGGHIKGADIL